jgi:hypothetical protein
VGSLGGMTNIQTIFDLVPTLLEACLVLWCYCSQSIPYAGFQVLKVVDLNLVDNILQIAPQEKFHEVKSGDLGGQVIGPILPIHFSAISLSR